MSEPEYRQTETRKWQRRALTSGAWYYVPRSKVPKRWIDEARDAEEKTPPEYAESGGVGESKACCARTAGGTACETLYHTLEPPCKQFCRDYLAGVAHGTNLLRRTRRLTHYGRDEDTIIGENRIDVSWTPAVRGRPARVTFDYVFNDPPSTRGFRYTATDATLGLGNAEAFLEWVYGAHDAPLALRVLHLFADAGAGTYPSEGPPGAGRAGTHKWAEAQLDIHGAHGHQTRISLVATSDLADFPAFLSDTIRVLGLAGWGGAAVAHPCSTEDERQRYERLEQEAEDEIAESDRARRQYALNLAWTGRATKEQIAAWQRERERAASSMAEWEAYVANNYPASRKPAHYVDHLAREEAAEQERKDDARRRREQSARRHRPPTPPPPPPPPRAKREQSARDEQKEAPATRARAHALELLTDVSRYVGGSGEIDDLERRQAIRQLSKLVHPDRCQIRTDIAATTAFRATPQLESKTRAFYDAFYPLASALPDESRIALCTEFTKVLNTLAK